MTNTEALVKAEIEKYEKAHENELDSLSLNETKNNIQFSKKFKVELSKDLFGQEQAVNIVANSMKNNVKDEKGPKSTYLFLGSPATGKTFLAELMAKHLPKYKIMKFDMTQYHQQNGGELYGYPTGWKGFGVGQLTGFVHRNPKAVIVLDAFEKCDNIIQNNLLSIFEGGRMRDACGWDKVTDEPCNEDPDITYSDENATYWVDFTEVIFIITTSLGKELYLDYRFKDLVKKDYIQAESMILEAIKREKKRDSRSGGLQEAIVPELVSRFSKANIVLFNKLDYDALEKISKKVFLTYIDEFNKQYEIEFDVANNFDNFLKIQILNFAPELDARRLKDKVSTIFFNRITSYIQDSEKPINSFKQIKVSISKDTMRFLNDRVNPLIEDETLVRELFRKNITLELNDKITEKNGVITYKVSSCKFLQVIRIKDFSEDGLVFDIPKVSFDDIAGHHKAKQRLREVINFFKEPKQLESFNIEPPKGMLLYGPPGTGKTMLAKAFAKEAELPFISVTGLELLQPEKTQQIFSKAKEYAPAIIFIDEIDTIGKREGENSNTVPINKLLSEMDGFSGKKGEHIFVIAATNYKENIDSAIIRPGRVEIHIEINNLDKDAREYFLNQIIEKKPASGAFDMNKLLMYTAGFTGSQLELLGKEASFYCLRHGLPAITQDILIEQINMIKYGERQSYLSLEEMFEETAIYEAGRTVISKVLMPHIHIEHVSLTPKDNNEHFVSLNYNDVQENMTVKDFKDKICVSLAGRTAQIKKFGDIDGMDTGASNDLQQATRDAYTAIAHYGMDKGVGYININGVMDAKENSISSKDTKHYHEKIETALERWMLEGEKHVTGLVNEYWSTIESLSKLLLEKEIIYEDELDEILAR
ncbi:AAA family ATPase [Candidatus Sulfurimonas marisnigri]|uniref:AAA family ATPase n=1 Tax=Candidatus Sulfurimonas marisnigri TaxID=2740405 RepID=A0A7S7LY41_9BACT|nr:AAA family ATPase [Candidatus Sulfurimonas marisnigri]QOY53597.1 AAA family ATPase [Candidatus Sulfurimonas marisnigri]